MQHSCLKNASKAPGLRHGAGTAATVDEDMVIPFGACFKSSSPSCYKTSSSVGCHDKADSTSEESGATPCKPAVLKPTAPPTAKQTVFPNGSSPTDGPMLSNLAVAQISMEMRDVPLPRAAISPSIQPSNDSNSLSEDSICSSRKQKTAEQGHGVALDVEQSDLSGGLSTPLHGGVQLPYLGTHNSLSGEGFPGEPKNWQCSHVTPDAVVVDCKAGRMERSAEWSVQADLDHSLTSQNNSSDENGDVLDKQQLRMHTYRHFLHRRPM